MPTALDLINETRQHLQAQARDELNKLNGAMDASTATATLEFPLAGINRGAIVAIDLELLHTWAIAGQTATVDRGFGGSVTATHADDSLVYVNPRFSSLAILRALAEEIDSYSSPAHGLFKTTTVDLSWNPVTSGYDLTVDNALGVLDVEATGYITGDRVRINRYRIIRNQDVGDMLTFYEPGFPGKPIRVTLKVPFTTLPLTSLTTDLTTTGLPVTAYDIPPLGAAARLLAGRESLRTQSDTQPEPRAAAEVPPGASRGQVGTLLQMRDRRIREESARLHATWPMVSRVS